jgi:hypothetical protein
MDYIAIRRWGIMLGSMRYYIDDQVNQARKDKAPQDAIYKRDNGTWARLRDIKDLDKRTDLRQFLDLV